MGMGLSNNGGLATMSEVCNIHHQNKFQEPNGNLLLLDKPIMQLNDGTLWCLGGNGGMVYTCKRR